MEWDEWFSNAFASFISTLKQLEAVGGVFSYWSELWLLMPWCYSTMTWWHHQMETFSALLALCAGNSPVAGEFRSQRPVMRSFDVFFDRRLNKQLSKQLWGWSFETPLHSLWHHCNEISITTLSEQLHKNLFLWPHEASQSVNDFWSSVSSVRNNNVLKKKIGSPVRVNADCLCRFMASLSLFVLP